MPKTPSNRACKSYDERKLRYMPNLDWSQWAVESIPGKVSGAWLFRDTRLPFATLASPAMEDISCTPNI